MNSIRARVDRVVAFLERADVDVLAMQETKCSDEQFPHLAFQLAGYDVVTHGHNQWNGVAVASRVGHEDVETGFAGMPTWGDPPAEEARALGVTCDGVRVWSLYVPNGRVLADPHYAYKLNWLDALREAAAGWVRADPGAKVALVGDWNIAPRDEDVWDMTRFEGATHVSPAEREAFRAFEDVGFTEVTRDLVTQYTYWDYKQLAFPRNKGMRIDFVQASRALAEQITGASIERAERKGKGPSDHVPVVVEVAG
ncbi:exodeoxyribonuclease III [Georgenia halophila]|uniref:Exodeoxyribonuclease III n=1 Tax=Georgenia halophila TaxID=620889 RepID=A0ABP8L0D3_9MICO